MRIIAGSAGGIPLRLPKHDIRPTMEKIRGAIFSSLGDRIIGARVLDLFAGSGAFGLEALSRGAANATFVDHRRDAIAAIQSNFEKTKLRGAIIRLDVFGFLKSNREPFDLIFADPPYSKSPSDPDPASQLLLSPFAVAALTNDGLLILERAAGSTAVDPRIWSVVRAKRYGGTEVLILAKSEAAENAARGARSAE
jgi:16S rRNA (guanine966-N2)-methyltransferase